MRNILQRVTSAASNEQDELQVTSDFLQQATSAICNERISQQATRDLFGTSNE